MSYITAIAPLETENLSGCVRLRISRLSDIAFFPRNIDGRLIGDIIFQPGKDWIEWNPIEGTYLFACDESDTMEGVTRTHTIQFTLPSKGVNEYVLQVMQRDKLVVLVTDHNYNNFVFGNPNMPLKFRYNRNTGNTRSGRNEYSCRFIGSQFPTRATYRMDTVTVQTYFPIIDQLGNELIDDLGNVLVYQE